LRRVAEPLLPPGLDLEELLDTFQAMLDSERIATVLRRDFYEPPYDSSIRNLLPENLVRSSPRAEVYNERRFAVRDRDRLLTGSIDRLVLLFDHEDRAAAAHVIDFKTDLVETAGARSIERLQEYYRPQIEAYCRAVSRMFALPRERVGSLLLFVGEHAT